MIIDEQILSSARFNVLSQRERSESVLRQLSLSLSLKALVIVLAVVIGIIAPT